MSNFIEVINCGDEEKILINVDYIVKIVPYEGQSSTIYLNVKSINNYSLQTITVKHSYSEIKKMLTIE